MSTADREVDAATRNAHAAASAETDDNPLEPLPEESAPSQIDAIVAPIMFYLSVAFLILAAGLIHRVGVDPSAATPLEEQAIAKGMLLLWPIFLVEGFVRFRVRRGQQSLRQRFLAYLFVCLFPPSRLVGRAYADPNMMWLPLLGWHHADKHLRRRLERFFSIPMIVVALLVLPVVGAEYIWAEKARDHFGLGLALDIGNSLIWAIFAFEFLVMISVADNKLRYCVQNWMDLAIVLLPLIDFLPLFRVLRLTRVLQVQQLSKMGRLYRMRGVLLKLWRAILVLDVLQRLIGNTPQKRLKQLRDLAAAKEEELAELRREIRELEHQLQAEGLITEEAPTDREPRPNDHTTP
jgi:voltage-gated potassium channel